MSEMVERLATVMAQRYDGLRDPSDLHRALIKELIEAMWEPTGVMRKAGDDPRAATIWQDMIDAALK